MKALEVRLVRQPGEERVVGRLAERGPGGRGLPTPAKRE